MLAKEHPLYHYRNEKMYKKDVGTLVEYPFFYDGMSFESFEEEKEYYVSHQKEWRDRTYKPLWKQRQEKQGKGK